MKKNLSDRIKEKARKVAEDDGQLKSLIDKVMTKAGELVQHEKLQALFSTVETFVKMVKSYLTGEYREYPKRTLLLILFGLIYFLMPLDAIPDFIPITGFIDDLSVLLWVSRSIQKDVEAFKDWEDQKVTIID